MDVVCHVITGLELGGAQEVAMHVVSGLDRSRFRPVLLAGPGGLLTDEARALDGADARFGMCDGAKPQQITAVTTSTCFTTPKGT